MLPSKCIHRENAMEMCWTHSFIFRYSAGGKQSKPWITCAIASGWASEIFASRRICRESKLLRPLRVWVSVVSIIQHFSTLNSFIHSIVVAIHETHQFLLGFVRVWQVRTNEICTDTGRHLLHVQFIRDARHIQERVSVTPSKQISLVFDVKIFVVRYD